jgi:hypothetical protein
LLKVRGEREKRERKRVGERKTDRGKVKEKERER